MHTDSNNTQSTARRPGGTRRARVIRSCLSATGTLALATALTGPAPVVADDINTAPAACVAPFLNQAFPMRWHENFLMNPLSGTRTWVICPLTYDNDVVDFDPNFSVAITGGITPGANTGDRPVCYMTVNDRRNLFQPPYIFGQQRRYVGGLNTLINSPVSGAWQANGSVTIAALSSSIGIGNRNDWSASVFCRLPPGYSVSQIRSIH